MRAEAVHPPGEIIPYLDESGSSNRTDQPRRAGSILVGVEVGRDREISWLLSEKAHRSLDPTQAERPDVPAQMVVADDVPMTLDEVQAVRIKGALKEAAVARRVGEAHRLTPRDGLLQTGELPAGPAGVLVRGERHRQLLELQAHGIAPSTQDGGKGHPQRPSVGEAAVQSSQGEGQGSDLRRGEVHGRQTEVIFGEKIQLRLDCLCGFCAAQNSYLDTHLRQVGSVAVETPGERIVAHQRITLDRISDLPGCERSGAAEEERYEG